MRIRNTRKSRGVSLVMGHEHVGRRKVGVCLRGGRQGPYVIWRIQIPCSSAHNTKLLTLLEIIYSSIVIELGIQ